MKRKRRQIACTKTGWKFITTTDAKKGAAMMNECSYSELMLNVGSPCQNLNLALIKGG